jgi:uncharacterized protein YndB with AHSA1/START domain
MADVLHDFPINVPPDRVFEAVATPRGLDTWWTKSSSGTPAKGAEYSLYFGPKYDWRARVTRCVLNELFELELVRAMDDWMGTRVRFELHPTPTGTQLRFAHTGWPEASEHYRTSSFCWAMYLRVMRRHLEYGESVPYEKRLEV